MGSQEIAWKLTSIKAAQPAGAKIAHRARTQGTATAMMNATVIAKFEHFFRVAAGLDIDKADLKRYGDFVNRKIQDLLLRGQAAAKANGRDIVEPWDLPITKGLQESIHAFRTVDIADDLSPFLAPWSRTHQLISLSARNARAISPRSRAASAWPSPASSRSSIPC
jgi:hypothetical protein